MAVNKSSIVIGPCRVTDQTVNLFSREPVRPRFLVNWQPVPVSMFGVVDKSVVDRRIEIPIRLWGAYENLGVLFPAVFREAKPGTLLFGAADNPIVLHARDGERFTFHNARITRLANLHFGVDQPLFAADLVYTAIIKNNTNPETANAYYTIDSAAFPADSGFAKTNYKQQRYSGAWTGKTGLTAYNTRNGWDLAWSIALNELNINGHGTIDFTIGESAIVGLKAIPIEPTFTQIDTAAAFQGTPLGTLLSAGAADHAITGSGVAITLKNAALVEHSAAFGTQELRNGELSWETVRNFTAGAIDPIVTIA